MKKKGLLLCSACMIVSLIVLVCAACGGKEKQEEGVELFFETSSLTLQEEESFPLVLQGVPEGAEVVWSSDDDAVATVSDVGLVTAVKQGSTMIRAAIGEDVAICSLTVTAYRLEPVLSIIPVNCSLTLYEMDEYNVRFALKYGDDIVEPESIFYGSSDETVAKINADGSVAAVKQGKAVITVRAVYQGRTAENSIAVTVLEPEMVLIADFAEREVLKGEPLVLNMTVMRGKEKIETVPDMAYAIKDEAIGAVKNGVFMGTQKGSTVITVSCTAEGEELSLEIPIRVREEYTVEFLSEGQQVYTATALDGETVDLPNSPVPPLGRIFSRWVCEGKEFTADEEIQDDKQVLATWLAATSVSFDNAEHVTVHEYSSFGEFNTDIPYCNEGFPEGNAVLQPQDLSTGMPPKADWYVILPAFDFSRYNGVYFTLSYNKSGGKIAVMGQEVVSSATDNREYLFGIVKNDEGWSLTLDGGIVAPLSETIATGEERLRFDFTVSTNDIYAQLTFSAMFYNMVDYMAVVYEVLEIVPEPDALNESNCIQYLNDLKEYLAAVEYFTAYESGTFVQPEKITRLRELLSSSVALNEYAAPENGLAGEWVDSPETNGLIWGDDFTQMAWVNGDVYALPVDGSKIIGNGAGTSLSSADYIENGVRFDTDKANTEYRVFLPKIDFTLYSKVSVAVATNNAPYISITPSVDDRIAFAGAGECVLVFEYDPSTAVLNVTLTCGTVTRTAEIVDTDVIHGAKRAAFTVWSAQQYTQTHVGQVIAQNIY